MAWWTQPPRSAEARRARATADGDVARDADENDKTLSLPVPPPPPPLSRSPLLCLLLLLLLAVAILHAPDASPETTAAAAKKGTASAEVYASKPAALSPGGGARWRRRARYQAVSPQFASTAADPKASPGPRASVRAASAAPAAMTPEESTAPRGGAFPRAILSAVIDAAAERRRKVMKSGTERAPVPARAVTTPAFRKKNVVLKGREGVSCFSFELFCFPLFSLSQKKRQTHGVQRCQGSRRPRRGRAPLLQSRRRGTGRGQERHLREGDEPGRVEAVVGEQGLSRVFFLRERGRVGVEVDERRRTIEDLIGLSLSLFFPLFLFLSLSFYLVHKLSSHRREAIVQGGGDLGPGRRGVEEGRGHR